MKLKREERGLLIMIAGLLLFYTVMIGLPWLANRLVDCPDGYLYSLWRGRCVGNLEFDLR